ncbi:hypothetical protein [Telmatospirillum sp. J64-1]|uniref:hypothetical protein n=1 Tax=Telmatospirillum sp. J64-1 TaxID=2502183 RepID=UPI00115F0D87|nr:hypothetical protein [Telmatospirillum sp. J64-1]
MAKQPEERAVEILAEMDALIHSCERQLEETRELYSANGLDAEKLKNFTADLPAAQRRELEEAIARDNQEIEDEVQRARLDADHAPRSVGRMKMRPMI